MTSNDSPDLPVAAIVSFAGEESHEFEAYGTDETDLTYKDDVKQGDELVRKADAERKIASLKADKTALEQNLEEEKRAKRKARRSERQKILNKIEKRLDEAEEKVEKYNALDRLNFNDAKARREELEELRDELQQQEKEYKEEFGATQIAKGKPKNKDVKPEKDEVQNK